MRKKSFVGATMPLLFCVLGLTTTCKKESITSTNPSKGSVSLVVKSSDQIIEKSSDLKSASADEFQVEIYDSSNAQLAVYSRLADVPASIELDAGEYYVTVFSKNRANAAFENPYYFGQSDHFTLEKGETETVAVQCYIANSKVTVSYSDNVKSNFVDYQVVATRGSDSLTFIKDDTRAGYFEPGKIDLVAKLTYSKLDGTIVTKTILGSISSATSRKHYELYVDASPDLGNSTLNVTVVDSLDTETITLAESSSTTSKTASELIQGDILITEVMPNPDMVADDLGEWFELYNNTTSSVNLNGLVVVSGSYSLEISLDYVLQSGGYVFLCKDSLGGAGAIYYYGSELTIVNSNGSLKLYNSSLSTAVLLSEMSYTSSPTGASWSLDPANFTYSLAATSSSWCTATTAYSTGDLGTPGATNPSCN